MSTPSDAPSVSVTVRLPVAILDQIDAIREQSRFRPTRSAAIRSLVEDSLGRDRGKAKRILPAA